MWRMCQRRARCAVLVPECPAERPVPPGADLRLEEGCVVHNRSTGAYVSVGGREIELTGAEVVRFELGHVVCEVESGPLPLLGQCVADSALGLQFPEPTGDGRTIRVRLTFRSSS